MSYTLEEKYALIRSAVQQSVSKNPVTVARAVMGQEFVSIHGPEHHFLDGAAFLAAYRNVGGNIDLEAALTELAKRTVKMPGAMCGLWGVCGAVASVGAALSVINGTGPLSEEQTYGENMVFTSSVIAKMSELGGPRCCKRNAFLTLSAAARFVRERYGIPMEADEIICEFSERNEQCIRERCPFHADKREEGA